MANLLYVTREMLELLKSHPAYLFWRPIMQNQPLRHVPLEERAFYPRDVAPESGGVYLTVDMNFVYCRDKQFSYMYEDQDLSFRFAAKDGILRTMDSKQFSALIGQVGFVVESTRVELRYPNQVYHSFFDSMNGHLKALLHSGADAGQGAAAPAAEAKPGPSEDEVQGVVLGRFPKSICDEMVRFRTSSKKSYCYLAQRFGLAENDIREICNHYLQKERNADLKKKASDSELARLSPADCEKIIRLKKVSKKSYGFLAKRFDVSEDVVRSICAPHLKRPRRR